MKQLGVLISRFRKPDVIYPFQCQNLVDGNEKRCTIMTLLFQSKKKCLALALLCLARSESMLAIITDAARIGKSVPAIVLNF